MLNDYITFNSARFVKDYYKCKRIVEELQRQLDELTYIRSVPTDADKVQTSPKGDQVEKLALRRMAIEERMHDCNLHIEAYETARDYLLPIEKTVIEEFFTSDTKQDATDKLEDKGISRSTAYIIRKQALEKIALHVAGVSHIEKRGE